MDQKIRLKVNKKRNFSAHHMLIGAARMALDDAKDEKPGWFYNQLMSIMFSALSVEAICNAFGERFVAGWKDFESANPIAKLRIVCEYLNVEVDFNNEPWVNALWLIKTRNKIAHAKPEIIDKNYEMSRDKYDYKRTEEPKSKIEELITLDRAIKAYESVEKILKILCNNVPAEDLLGLQSDAWQGSATVIGDD